MVVSVIVLQVRKTATLRLYSSKTAQWITMIFMPYKSRAKTLQNSCWSFSDCTAPSCRTLVTEFLLSCLFIIVVLFQPNRLTDASRKTVGPMALKLCMYMGDSLELLHVFRVKPSLADHGS